MSSSSSGHLKVEPPATVAAMLRMWLRRRRLLVASVALTIVLVPSLLFMVNVNATYVLSPADYDAYDYDAVDGVHALVHEMSHNKARRDVIGIRFLRSPKHIRTQSAHHTYDDEDDDDEGARGGAFPRAGSLKSRRPVGGSRKGIFRRKIQDSEDVPPEDVKGYAFLHKKMPALTTKALPPVNDNMGKEGGADDEIYHANEDEDDYGVGDKEENPQEAMFEPHPGDEEDKEEEYLENEENEYDYWSRNKEFKAGDFDAMPKNLIQRRPVLKYEDLPNEDSEAAPQRPLNSLVRARGGDGQVVAHKASSTHHPQGDHPLLIDSAHQKQQLPHVVESSLNYEPGKDSKLRFVPNCDQTQTAGCKPVTSSRDRTIQKPSKARKALMRGGGNEIQYPQQQTQQQQNQHQQHRQKSIPSRLNKSPTKLRGPEDPNNELVANRPAMANRSLEASLTSSKTIVEYAHHLPLHEQPATQLQVPELPPQQGEVISRAGYKLVRGRIYWSEQVERFVSPGITAENVAAFREKVGRLQVSEMREPQWNRCGRPKNQYVILEDGSALCARYRAPHTKMIQGEILSFYLARLLGVDSVPVSVLAEVNSNASQWSRVTPARAGWEDGQVVVFIQWIEGLDKIWSQVKMPSLILSAYQKGVPVDRNHPALPTMSPTELGELLQWSDMILFDYIIGHYDRVASMQDGAEREQKASIMSESIRNLRKVPSTNKLWFVDNESGLFDGYELMKYGRKNGPRFVHFHEQMLQTMCLFRRSLVENIEQLARHSDPQEVLTQFTAAHEPLYTKLPSVSKVKYFKQFFHTRLKEVVAWVEKCRAS